MRPIPPRTPLPHELEEAEKTKAQGCWQKVKNFLFWLISAIVAGLSALIEAIF